MTDDLPLFQLTSFQRRMIDAAVEIEECTPDTVEFLHAVLCQVGLPRSSTTERIFERNNGRASIRVEAGALYKGGKWIEQQLPYGPELTKRPFLSHKRTKEERARPLFQRNQAFKGSWDH
jgi:hypothetical protein